MWGLIKYCIQMFFFFHYRRQLKGKTTKGKGPIIAALVKENSGKDSDRIQKGTPLLSKCEL